MTKKEQEYNTASEMAHTSPALFLVVKRGSYRAKYPELAQIAHANLPKYFAERNATAQQSA